MTAEQVMRLERKIISEASCWERTSAEECQLLAYYNEGIHDMAGKIIEVIDNESKLESEGLV